VASTVIAIGDELLAGFQQDTVIRFLGDDPRPVAEATEIVRQRVAPMGLTPAG
jgi:hypothetical protein